MSKPRAIIDLGTNTFQLLIAESDASGNLHTIHEMHTAVGLGKGAMETGLIQLDAMARALEALERFLWESQNKGCESILGIGTSVLRNARNAPAFIEVVESQLGIPIQVISGMQEAEYIFQGIVNSMPQPWNEVSMVMDIGGGSVEFIIFQGQEILFKSSVEVGGLKLQSMFQVEGEYGLPIEEALKQYLFSELSDVQDAVALFRPKYLIGAAGAFETLADIQLAHGYLNQIEKTNELNLSGFYLLKEKMAGMSLAERQEIPGMKAFRASMIPYANSLIAHILDQGIIESLWMSMYSLKEGYWFSSQE